MQCPVCHQGTLSPVKGDFYDYLSQKRFDVWQCDQCDSMKTVGDTKGDFYGQAYYGSEKGKFSPLVEKIFTANHRRNANRFFRQFRPETVLEIGCGRAYILAELKKLGCTVNGLESADATDWILNNTEVPVHGVRDGEKWPFEDNSQNLVIIWHVLEHVSDPEAVLKEIKRVLSPSGTLCISVPNADSLQSKISLPQWFHLDVPRHLYHFSSNGLKTLLHDVGYDINKATSGDITQNLYGWWQTLSNFLTPKSNNLLYRFIQGGEPWKTAQRRNRLWIHLLALPLLVPLGILGWITEEIMRKPGNMTLYVSKNALSSD